MHPATALMKAFGQRLRVKLQAAGKTEAGEVIEVGRQGLNRVA